MKTLRLLADENIPGLDTLCDNWASIRYCAGREITATDLQDIDALLVRSVTEVNSKLLTNSSVKFIGSATIGVDHIDRDYLQQRGIGFAYAPGCNANAVVDYVMSALLSLYSNAELQQRCIGIIGCGNVGSRLLRCLLHFGLHLKVFDPLVSIDTRAYSNAEQVQSLDALMDCDVISLHVPLTTSGDYPTRYLFDLQRLRALAPSTLLVNSSRGAVVDNTAAKQVLAERPDLTLLLDVWESEPNIDLELYQLCKIATPHIAGYSPEGKLKGTIAIVEAAKAFFSINSAPAKNSLNTTALSSIKNLDQYRQQLQSIYQASIDSELFYQQLLNAAVIGNGQGAAGQIFDDYRKNYTQHYPTRSEINYDIDK